MVLNVSAAEHGPEANLEVENVLIRARSGSIAVKLHGASAVGAKLACCRLDADCQPALLCQLQCFCPDLLGRCHGHASLRREWASPVLGGVQPDGSPLSHQTKHFFVFVIKKQQGRC